MTRSSPNIKNMTIAICLAILYLFAPVIYADNLPNNNYVAYNYVNDYAHILTPGQRQNIDANLSSFDKQTSNQIVVATFNSLNGQSLENFSINLANKWKIGTKKNNNGVLLLIIKNDKKIRIEVGRGLEGALTDGLSGDIIRNQISPEFKQQNFYQGIKNGVYSIEKATKGEYKFDQDKNNQDNQDNQDKSATLFGILILTFIAIVIISYLRSAISYVKKSNITISSLKKNRGYYARSSCLFLLKLFINIFINALLSGRSSSCYNNSSSDDYSFFSGGGGGFGGGGASGGW